ncbi:MAG TPA: sensor histidine kinase, partial [Planctomycetota bacterium]|nr:sensor histidine kinase [Planctomycetota bacterium]
LLDNAVKYAADGGAVELRAFRTGARYAIEVADRGPGFDEADRERLFGLFERGASSAAREKPGLGIGLALSRRIVEANRGLLTARRRDGGGSVFAIEAPIAGVDA